ncbi:Uncharacterized protein APZ42_031609 [Daphnia magna]|uniref:Uncharacterized protein n=1 Tax=Daphnia magna TaxID=35525 RepID=A0A164MQB4_9CRUS|nr:Uncharacterized protein APZ42_031609 [Daphnia magna]
MEWNHISDGTQPDQHVFSTAVRLRNNFVAILSTDIYFVTFVNYLFRISGRTLEIGANARSLDVTLGSELEH